MPVKTDKKDARGIAQLMRLGWFRPVHCKSLAGQEIRALLTARKRDYAASCEASGSRSGRLRPPTFAARVRALVVDHPTLMRATEALLAARAELLRQFKALDRRLVMAGRADAARGD